MKSELHIKYRPQEWKEVVGQEEAVRVLRDKVKNNTVPHAILFSGPPGTGKTTLARILREKIGCGTADFHDKNCASQESVMDMVRGIEQRMGLSPVGGSCRVWLLDEVQSMSRAQFAQQALLKILEDGPEHCYFFLATTDPTKVIKAIRTRCTEISLKSVPPAKLKALLLDVMAREKIKVSDAVLERIIEISDGSPRQVLNNLNKVYTITDEPGQLAMLQPDEVVAKAYDLVRALVWDKPDLQKVRKLIVNIGEQDWESFRHLVLANARVAYAQGKYDRAVAVMDAFECNWYDSRGVGLVLACEKVMRNK